MIQADSAHGTAGTGSEERRETESIGLSRNRKTKTTKRRRSRREQNRVYKALKHKGKEQA
jgi:hypothetical protein